MLAQQKSQEELQRRNVQLHCEYSKKIDNLVTVVKKMEETFMTQQQCHEELQSRNVHLHHEYSQKIDNLVSVIKDCQEELQIRNVEVNKISAVLEKTEDLPDTPACVNISTDTINEQVTCKSIPRHEHMKTSVETQHNEHDMHSSDENHTIKFWVVGSSIVKDLRKNLIYKYKKTNITTLRDKTVYGASEFLMSGKLKANNIAYQVGSNDLEDSTAGEVVNSIKRLVLDTQRLVPGNNIIINGILPRFYRNLQQRKQYETKRIKCNCMLSELCDSYGLKFVNHENLTQIHFEDGIHLSHDGGIAQYVRNLKEVVNPLLGITNAIS